MTTRRTTTRRGYHPVVQEMMDLSPRPTRRTTRRALFICLECGKKFYTTKSAERAAFGSRGCPGCGGADISPNY